MENQWLVQSDLVSHSGHQQVTIEYENLSKEEIFDALGTFYNKFYFRPRPILRIVGAMIRDRDICKRRLTEAREFFSFLQTRKNGL